MVNTNVKISFVIYDLNSNSLHSRQDGWNCSQCGSRCETRPRKNCWTTVILLRAMGHCWLEMTAVEWNFIAWNAYFTHFSQNFPENLPFHRASQIPQNSTYFTTFFTRETGDLLVIRSNRTLRTRKLCKRTRGGVKRYDFRQSFKPIANI